MPWYPCCCDSCHWEVVLSGASPSSLNGTYVFPNTPNYCDENPDTDCICEDGCERYESHGVPSLDIPHTRLTFYGPAGRPGHAEQMILFGIFAGFASSEVVIDLCDIDDLELIWTGTQPPGWDLSGATCLLSSVS